MFAHRVPQLNLVARSVGLTLLSVVLVLTGTSLVSPAHAALPVAPTGLAATFPTGSSGLPILAWERVADATSYDVQVATSPGFVTTLASTSTVNLTYVPSVQLPVGQLWFRVRGKNTSGSGDWSTISFSRDPISAPVPTQPSDGAVLDQPDNPALFGWRPVPGVTKYEIQISTDSAFTDPALIKGYSTQTTSLVLPALQVPTATYHWRVRGQLGTGIYTAWSDARSYAVNGLPPADVLAPDDDVNQAVQDAVLSWTPVPGAATYDLQISTDQNFLTVDHSVSGVTGTTYARPATLDNDQYYWRVRPVDSSGNERDWSLVPVWQFRRNWPDQPHLMSPADDATIGDPFFVQWSPVALATRYTVEFSRNSTFSPASSVTECTTVHTTLTPDRDDCWPDAVGTYYWRVVAQDLFTSSSVGPTTDGISSEVRRFTYAPETVQLSTPAPGAEVTVPTLRWQPVAGAAKYRVTVTGVSNGKTTTLTTAATSFTPRAILEPDQTYRWQVQTVSEDGRLGASTLAGGQRMFIVREQPEPTANTPEPTSPSGQTSARFPTLTWQPVVNATEYKVWMRAVGATGVTPLSDVFEYPAGEDEGTARLTPGDYEWFVEAYENGTFLSQSHGWGTFTISTLPAVSGHRVALTGTTLGSDSCQSSLPNECQNLRQTPVLSWDAEPGVGYYRLYVSRDREMTNLVPTFPVNVYATIWAARNALPDSQAGSAYYWYVQPCSAGGACRALEHAGHAFNKRSAPVRLSSPANGAAVADAVTLTWQDYLASQSDAANTVDTALQTPAPLEARRYKVQTATDENFQNVIETVDVDQRSFTSFIKTYPEGPIYWRVQAIDATNNPLTWSATGTFVKSSPAPVPTAPASGAEVSGAEPLVWDALAFAASYDVEVYKADDQVPSPANLVVSANAKQIAYSLATPLPVSDQNYRWRVRRVDATGRKGRWSPLTPFRVVADTPTLTAPIAGVRVSPSEALFQWEPLPEAASYRFERRLEGGSTIAETVTTPSLAWAPRAVLAGGNWQWRVTALDNEEKALGASEWRSFSVLAGPSAVSAPVVTGTGRVGTTLTATDASWNLPDVTTTYQWYRGSGAIAGATEQVYELVDADYGKAISVRATGRLAGYADGTSASNAVTGIAAAAPTPSTLPAITGSARYEQTLTANPGTWPHSPSYSYLWLRNGGAISGATRSTYRVTASDAGASLSVRVSAKKSGYDEGVATSSAVRVAKLSASASGSLAKSRIKVRTRVRFEATVKVTGQSFPSGIVTVYVGKKKIKAVRLTSSARGKISVRLPALSRGKHSVTARYSGTTVANAAASRVRRLTVTR